MTPQEALGLLRGGSANHENWNAQRDGKNLDLIDLRGCDLQGAQLSGFRLDTLDLAGANLSGASLAGVVMTPGPHLLNTNLSGADLQRTRLEKTRLNGADLTAANLNRAKVIGVKLDGARLHRAVLDGVDLWNVDVERVRLEPGSFWARLKAAVGGFVFHWRVVRAVGNLQVLTRASYVMLALVPLLAGIWQGVKYRANQTREEVADTVRLLDERIEKRSGNVSSEHQHELDQLRRASSKAKELIDRGEFDHKLPSAWALGYFAALCVVLGHFVYQIAAPELVKSQTADQYAKTVLGEFHSNTHSQRERVLHAVALLRGRATRWPSLYHPNLVYRYSRVVWIPPTMDLFARPAPPPERTFAGEAAGSTRTEPKPDEEKMMVAIEEGAKAEYDIEATTFWGAAAAALLFYVSAGLLVLWLVGSQSWSVVKSAGWA